MTDDLRALARDLARYLTQQREAGVRWYLDEGPPAVLAPPPPRPAAAVEAASPETPVAAPEKKASPPAKPASKPAAEPAADDFVAACSRFVAATLKQIEANGASQSVAAEGDLFADEADAPPTDTAEQKAAALEAMKVEVSACESCKLAPSRTNTVFGAGAPDSGIVFVGEAPGRNEDEQGEPFVGRSGKLLTDILKAIGFARDEIFICNILKCRPPNNRDPEPDEVQACEPFLKRQLAIIRPKVICCLGRQAAMTLLQTRSSLRAMRETVHFYEGIPVMATFHPAALLRNPHWKRDTWDDVRKLRALYDALTVDA